MKPLEDRRNSLEDDHQERRMEPKKTEILYIKTPPAAAKRETESLDSFDASIPGISCSMCASVNLGKTVKKFN